MRLWHYKLIPYIDRQHLLAQWRECCLIAKNISDKGTPNHILVNKIMNYPLSEFIGYSLQIADEMERREYKVNRERFWKYFKESDWDAQYYIDLDELFKGWHNDRYLKQCLNNLEEKFDCGGISTNEWNKIMNKYDYVIKESKTNEN